MGFFYNFNRLNIFLGGKFSYEVLRIKLCYRCH